MKIDFCIPSLLGVEGLIADELRFLGAENVAAENGRILFSGDENMLARVNICSHFAERVQILMGSFEAKTFEELFQGVKDLPWEQWIGKEDAFPVKGYSLKSQLFSVSDCQAIIKKAVVERLKSKYGVSWFTETGPVHQIQFSIMNDKATLLIDTTGAGLHKRGYRLSQNGAPMKETLAAALCALAKVRHYHTLYDPMCGSGTLLLEGALYAHNIAPGLNRHFAAERFEVLPKNIWAEEKERARSLEKVDTDFQGFGSDIDPMAIKIATENAARLPIGKKLHFEKRDIKDFKRYSERGTVICNPPYGERLLDLQEAEEIYKQMGKVFTQQHGWSYYVITPDEEFENCFGRKADKSRKLYNGMIKCRYYMFFK